MPIRPVRQALLIVSLLCASWLPVALAEKFGPLQFTTPPGWTFNGSNPNLATFTPADTTSEQVRMLMLPVGSVQGDPRTWFEMVAQQFASDGRSEVLASTTETRGPDGQSQVFLQGRAVTLAGGQQVRVILAVVHNKKAVVMALVGSTPAVISQYQEDLVQLAESAARNLSGQGVPATSSAAQTVPTSPVSSAAQPVKTPVNTTPSPAGNTPGGAALSGAYAHWNADPVGSCGGICWSFMVFQPNGQVFAGEPPATLADIKCPGKNCEPYRVQGNQLIISGKGKPWRKDGQNLVVDGLTYHRINTYNNLKLSGTYRAGGALQIPGVVASSTVRQLTFSPGGQFTSSENMGTLAGPANAWSQQAGGGTYRITGNTLELRFQGGQVMKGFFFVMPGRNPDPSRPGGFYFNGNNFTSED